MSMEENTGSSHGTFSDVSPITTSWYHEDSPSSLLQSPMMLGVKAQLHRLTCAAVLCDGIVQLDTQDCFCPGTFWGRERTHKHTVLVSIGNHTSDFFNLEGTSVSRLCERCLKVM